GQGRTAVRRAGREAPGPRARGGRNRPVARVRDERREAFQVGGARQAADPREAELDRARSLPAVARGRARGPVAARPRLPRGACRPAAAARAAADRAIGLVAPVEVARAAPEPVVLELRSAVLGGVLAGPREDRLRRVGDDVRLHAVHGLLDASLLLGLEKRMVVERILDLVLVDRHRGLELLVALLQL